MIEELKTKKKTVQLDEEVNIKTNRTRSKTIFVYGYLYLCRLILVFNLIQVFHLYVAMSFMCCKNGYTARILFSSFKYTQKINKYTRIQIRNLNELSNA